MNRRDFFKVTFAAGVASIAPAVLSNTLPVIYGDGKHDDTEGLQAALDDKPFECLDGSVRIIEGQVFLSNAVYLVSKTLTIPHNKVGMMENLRINCAKNFVGSCVLYFDAPDRPVVMTGYRIGR